MSRLVKAGIFVAVIAGGLAASFALSNALRSDDAGPSGPAAVPSQSLQPEQSPQAAQGGACHKSELIGTTMVDNIRARRAPRPGSPIVDTFARRNLQGARQVFLLTRAVRGADGHRWFDALLPVRPNGTHGFIPAADVRLSKTSYRLVVDRHRLSLTLLDRCRTVQTFPVGIGTKDTPTPVGHFYLASLIRPPSPDSVYGAFAYALSGYSTVIRNWRWGGLVGLHGTNDPSSVGKLESHGCIRMLNKDIRLLVRILPLGTPITIL